MLPLVSIVYPILSSIMIQKCVSLLVQIHSILIIFNKHVLNVEILVLLAHMKINALLVKLVDIFKLEKMVIGVFA
jgi:hypothetical protein